MVEEVGRIVVPPRCKLCRQMLGPDVKFYEATVTVHHLGRGVVASQEFYHYGACPKPDGPPQPGRFNNLDMP